MKAPDSFGPEQEGVAETRLGEAAPPSIQCELTHLALKKLRPLSFQHTDTIFHLENAATEWRYLDVTMLSEAGEREDWFLRGINVCCICPI